MMRETKIRFGTRAWLLIQEEAKLEGVSASQFVREAALARAIYTSVRRAGRDGEIAQAHDLIVGLIRTLNP